MNMSRPPSLGRASSTTLSGSPGFEMSAAAHPAALIALPVDSMAAASRDEMKTWEPSAASASAQARPNPLLAAVTNARRSVSPRSISRLSLACRVHVPLGDVHEPVCGLDTLIYGHTVHPLRHRVVVVRRVKEDGRRCVGHQRLEVDVRAQPRLRVDRAPPVLEVAVDQPPPPGVREVQGIWIGAGVPQRVLVRVRADVKGR